LVEEALKGLKDIKASLTLDIGTGSGCIAIALAKNLPSAKIIATDISPQALEIAKENAATHEVSDRIEFILSDIAPWKTFQAQDKKFDLIVSNPPYIASQDIAGLQNEVSGYEPRLALDGGILGSELPQKILEEAFKFLKKDGLLLMEIGEGQAEPLRAQTSLDFETRKDLQGVERIVLLKK
jgi:release factor glutamine methyltransferase